MSAPQPIPAPLPVARIRPYRRFLTSALHRRFVHASALALMVCWDDAFWLGKKTSCRCCRQSADEALTCSRFLVVVPNQLHWCPSYPRLRLMFSCLHTARGYPTPWSAKHSITVRHLSWVCLWPKYSPDTLLVSVFSMVVQRGLHLDIFKIGEPGVDSERRHEHTRQTQRATDLPSKRFSLAGPLSDRYPHIQRLLLSAHPSLRPDQDSCP